MTNLTTLDLVQALVLANDETIILIDSWNNGGSSNWPGAFPSLNADQIEMLGEPLAIRFDDKSEAQAAFTQICSDLEDGSSLVGALVHYVGRDRQSIQRPSERPLQTVTFDSSLDSHRPIFEDGMLSHVMMTERL